MATVSRVATKPKQTGIAPEKLKRIIASRGFCTLATAAAGGAPHIVGVTYQYVDSNLYIATGAPTKKARNIRENPRVAVHIPVRQYPMGPPWSVQFQGTASVLGRDDPEIVRLLESGKLKKITGHGLLNESDVCFLKVKPARQMHTYGIGLSLREVMRDIAHADRTVTLSENGG
jgi:nitroimidazol reductase NimA-like FMN-containing flavoprotein (pyridoxamine 5'-phosphate oxidase superfamily)